MKYLINFRRSLNLSLINREVELNLSLAIDCVFIEHHNNITRVNLMITNTKRYVPVVTLSINDNIKFLEDLKQRFKRIISWNKYRSEITTQPKNKNLGYMFNPTFSNIKIYCLFFHSKMVTMILQEIFLINNTCR